MSGEARRSTLRLARRDAAARALAGALRWASACFLVWSLAILASVLYEYPPLAYHALMVVILGTLPAFLFWPPVPGAFMSLVRRVDERSAVEAWLEYEGGPADRLLETRAADVLRVRAAFEPVRARPGPAFLAATAAGLAAFIAAQALSMAAGYGVSLGYADRSVRDEAVRLAEDAGVVPEADSLVTRDVPDAGDPAPLARRPGDMADEAFPLPSDGMSPTTGLRSGDESPEAGTAGGRPEADSEATGTGQGEPDPGDVAGAVSPGDASSGEGEDGMGSSRAPGWEGAGQALAASPLVDYRAAFERAYVERTGRDSALGGKAAPGAAGRAIADYYASFDVRVAIDAADSPELELLRRAWTRAFPAGGTR